MDENCNNMYGEMEIDLLDLLFYLLRRWRTFLVVLLLGIVAGGVVYIVKKPQPVEPGLQASETEGISIDYDGYEVDPEVRLNMDLAYDYRILYNKQMKYNQESLVMNMDPNQVYYGELRYYLAAGEDTRLISELYTDIYTDDDFVKEIMEAGGLDCDVQYAREILGCSANREHDASIEINNFINERFEDTGLSYNNAVISFAVCYSNQTACEKMLRTIEGKVEEKTQNNQEQYKEYIFEKLNTSIRQGVNSDYLTRQKNGTDAVNTYVSNITRIESSFTPEDKEYYRVVYLSREPLLLETEEGDADAVPVEESQPVDPMKLLMKWMVISVFVACVCWGLSLIHI